MADDRWTAETEELASERARAAYDRVVIEHGAIGHRAGHHDAILAATNAVLTALADAGLLLPTTAPGPAQRSVPSPAGSE